MPISILVGENHEIRAAMQDETLYLTGGILLDALPEGVTLENAVDYDYRDGLRQEASGAPDCLPAPLETRVEALEAKTESLDEINAALNILLGVQ